jgi:GNAT superfamily N-acetyltransferase
MDTEQSVAGVSIREMTLADIPAGLRLCRASRWNQTERDWRYFLSSAPQGALVAEENGVVIGTVATLPYGPFAWISMVLVDPEARGRGIGTLLLHRGLALIPEGVAARLDATPAGEVLYRRLGFAGEYGLARWFLDRPVTATRPPAARAAGTRPLERRDWPAILDMDLRAFGASRSKFLEHLAHEAPEYAWVRESKGGGLHGFLFGRHGHVREHLGPMVADDHETARALLESCLASHAGRPAFLDAPDDQPAWTAFLSAAGFAVERPFLRMCRGPLIAPGQPSLIFAISGPEFG